MKSFNPTPVGRFLSSVSGLDVLQQYFSKLHQMLSEPENCWFPASVYFLILFFSKTSSFSPREALKCTFFQDDCSFLSQAYQGWLLSSHYSTVHTAVNFSSAIWQNKTNGMTIPGTVATHKSKQTVLQHRRNFFSRGKKVSRAFEICIPWYYIQVHLLQVTTGQSQPRVCTPEKLHFPKQWARVYIKCWTSGGNP